ncbi:MAG: RIP metalloprotease RseP [Patescibacteria group bacterium]
MNILIFLIILLVVVLVHEFGHFFAAKKFGMRVDEFGFGFPPKLFGIKKGETEYTFNLLPLGGFVKIFGENAEEEIQTPPPNPLPKEEGERFTDKPKYQQGIVIFAGVFMNFILAWLLFSVGFMIGLPISSGAVTEKNKDKIQDISLVITSVLPNSPAEKAGLKMGDKILSIDLLENPTPQSLKDYINLNQKEKIIINYTNTNNNSISQTTSLTPQNVILTPIDGKIGIAMEEVGIIKLPILEALKDGMRITLLTARGMVIGLYDLISDGIRGRGSLDAVAGPVGIVGIVGDAYRSGFVYLLSFTAIISINLAVINLIPFPALDGGRLFFILIEKIKGSAINPKVFNIINASGFIILLALMLFVTYNDIIKLII